MAYPSLLHDIYDIFLVSYLIEISIYLSNRCGLRTKQGMFGLYRVLHENYSEPIVTGDR